MAGGSDAARHFFAWHIEEAPVARLLISEKMVSYETKSAPLGCALGAKVDGCQSNRASARECAKAHSFCGLAYRGDASGTYADYL